MELLMLNTPTGLKPMYDEDYDEKKKLKMGEVYKVSVKKARNYQFHKRYFSLINTAWEYQNEKRQEFFHNSVECFRKTVEISAGHCDTIYSLKRKEWVDVPKSIAFDKMDEFEFMNLYDRVRDVLFSTFLTHISQREFDNELQSYL